VHSLKVLQIGMHERGAAGGVDRVFWNLYDHLTPYSDLNLSAFFFQHQTDRPVSERQDPPDGSRSREFHLGSTVRPAYRRLWNVRRGVMGDLRGLPVSTPRLVASHFALYAAALLPNLFRMNHVVHFHGPWAAETAAEGRRQVNVTAKRAIERAVYSSANAFVTLSHAFKDLLATEYRVDPDRISVIPGGVDLERFSPGDRDSARALLGWPEQASVLFCVRRLVRRMGLESLIESFAAVARRQAGSMLIIGGTGPLRAELEAQVKSHNLSDRVRFTGFIPEADLPSAYRAADLSIVPSESLEGFGLTVVESLACGTPVLVTPVGGLPEILRPLDASLILPSTDSSALADQLERFFSGKMSLPSAEKCRVYVEANFSWAKIAEQTKALYWKVAAGA
jgi:glycosyltransferase involved in cell wall biosynthesis